MGRVSLDKEAEPSAPASNFVDIYMDTNDNRVKSKDYNGIVSQLGDYSSRVANIIMNGGFIVQQRVAVASTAITGVSTTTRAGVVSDRWAVTTSVASNLNWQQVDTNGAEETGLNSRFYGSIISATAGKKVMLSQFIINRECAHLKGVKVRLTLKIKQKVGSAQTYRLGLIQLNSAGTIDVCPAFLSGAWSTTTGVDPAWNTNLAAITPQATGARNGTITGNFLNITTSASWQKCSMVFTLPTNFKNLIPVIFSDATGGTTDNISISEFGLYQGEEDVDWAEIPFALTLTKCQEFYVKTFPYTTVPAQNAGVTTGALVCIVGIAAAAALADVFYWRFPQEMWKTPVTVTLYNPGVANAQARRTTGAAAADQTATATKDISAGSVSITATGDASGVVGNQVILHVSADAEIVN